MESRIKKLIAREGIFFTPYFVLIFLLGFIRSQRGGVVNAGRLLSFLFLWVTVYAAVRFFVWAFTQSKWKKEVNIDRKLVAKQGLIILVIIFSGLFVMKTGGYLYDHFSAKEAPRIEVSLTDDEEKAMDVIRDFRKKYPQYKYLNDITLATELAKTFSMYEGIDEKARSYLLKNKKAEDKARRVNHGFKKAAKRYFLVREAGKYIIIFGYPCYLVIIFMLWAARTLKE